MPKAVKLGPDMIETHPPPAAATAARTPRISAPKPEPTMPLQLRLPRTEVRRIKIAAAEREQTISQFMLACVHANMQSDAQ
jgi:hypothetical protein